MNAKISLKMAVKLTVIDLPERLLKLGYHPAASHHNHVEIDRIKMAYLALHWSEPSQLCPHLCWSEENRAREQGTLCQRQMFRVKMLLGTRR
jgi:hypothetical protein